mmetsp:Transcript_18485/g.38847  ORF Transcript_18485/g.38847 Transcript_18485/m.38847 type:complete len:224 (+) Transcript_18485:1130-1801(+)
MQHGEALFKCRPALSSHARKKGRCSRTSRYGHRGVFLERNRRIRIRVRIRVAGTKSTIHRRRLSLFVGVTVTVTVTIALLPLLFRHSNVSKGLGRFVHGSLVANVQVAESCTGIALTLARTRAGIATIAIAVLGLFLLQKPPGSVGLPLPDAMHYLLDDFQLGSLGRSSVFRIVFFQQFVEENVARMEPNALAPPAQDIAIGGSKNLGDCFFGLGGRQRRRRR